MKVFIPLRLVLSAPSFALDFVNVKNQLPSLGVTPAALELPAAPAVPPAEDEALERLRGFDAEVEADGAFRGCRVSIGRVHGRSLA